MYKWSWVIFVKKSKFHDAGGPDTVVSPFVNQLLFIKQIVFEYEGKTEASFLRGFILDKLIFWKVGFMLYHIQK